MITADFTDNKTLETFYAAIKAKHKEAHGDLYTSHHTELSYFFTSGVAKTYRELGVMQGATAACAEVSGATHLHLIDIDLAKFEPYRHLFKHIVTTEKSSLSLTKDELYDVDVLLIDTLHDPKHVTAELNLYAPYTTKYIIIHDTFAEPTIHSAIKRWCVTNPWEVEIYFNLNVGFTELKRKN